VFEVPSFETFTEAFKDEYYLKVVQPDERLFVDTSVGVMRARGEVKTVL
jgi:hypothetical protein